MRRALFLAVIFLFACDGSGADTDDRSVEERYCQMIEEQCDGAEYDTCLISQSNVPGECYWQWEALRECDIAANECPNEPSEGPCAAEHAEYRACVDTLE